MNHDPVVTIPQYKALPGKESELLELVKVHYPTLKSEGLVTDRQPYMFQTNNRTIIEVFEWRSKEAIEIAHQSKRVLEIWDEMEKIAEMTSLSSIEEANYPFPNFTPLNLQKDIT